MSAGDDLLGSDPLLALSGVAAMALVCCAILAVGWRRRRAAALDAAIASEQAMISGRARRLARAARLDDDPILASLGIGRTRPTGPVEPGRTKRKDRS
jgi:hypothetical protein